VAARLRKFVKLWIDLFAKHALLDHASATAFSVLKALVPLTLLGLALLGALGQERVWEKTLAPGIEPQVRPATFHAIDAAVQQIFATGSTGLIVFSGALVAWYVSGSVRGVMTGMNQIYECKETRPWKVRYAISIGLGVAIAVCVIGAALAVLAGPALARHGVLQVAVDFGRLLVAIVLLLAAVALLVRFAPAAPRSGGWVTGGSIVVILAWVAASMIFRLFVTDVANFKTAAGNLTVLLVLSGYVYTSAIIFLVGVELDELLREDATEGQRGVLGILGIAR
jgi:membrane protein